MSKIAIGELAIGIVKMVATFFVSVTFVIAMIWMQFGGIYHVFKSHGNTDGYTAAFIPPYSWFRAVEFFFHKDQELMAKNEQVDEINIMTIDSSHISNTLQEEPLAGELVLTDDAWMKLINYISNLENHEYHFTSKEEGKVYDVTALVPLDGPITLKVQNAAEPNSESVSLIDTDRNQVWDIMRVTNFLDGKEETRDLTTVDLGTEQLAQLLITWRITWSEIYKNLKMALSL